ncbi:hypothetical protein K474DRAFT_1671924 [Panus rudis PR-1116 ss-1]|nr:hypothetical protein K474DRAFT_1671924 [Panus rudis PR-1116 ss-1]
MSDALSQLGLDAAEAVAILSVDRTDFMINFSVLTFLVYDTVLTFPQEEYRHYNSYSSPAMYRCKIIYYGGIVSEIISFIAIAVLAFECLRVWAISGRSWWLASVVLILAIFAPAVDIKTAHTIRASQNLSLETKYTSLLLYTGVIQFVLLLGLNILNILFDILAITTDGSTTSQVILINEGLILNLRSVEFQDGSRNSRGSIRSSIRFTNSIVGNLGASTRRDSLSFNSAELDDILENEETVYSDNPLEVGLVDQESEAEIEMQPLGESSNDIGEAGPSGHHHEDNRGWA